MHLHTLKFGSFAWPIFEGFARLGEGIWMYGALDDACFVNCAYISMIQGDMAGSTKMNGMAGILQYMETASAW